MPGLKLDKFGGMLPAWDDRLLPDGQGAYAQNCYLFSGTLKGWRQPKLLHTLQNTSARYAYRIPSPVSNNLVITAPDALWLEFLDPDTTVMRTPVAQDTYNRYYFASPSQTPQYNTYARMQQGLPAWQLGVPASACAPGVTVDGGGDSLTLGFPNVINTGTAYLYSNQMVLIPIIATGGLSISDIQLAMLTTDPAANFQGAIYTDSNGIPSALIGTTDITTGCTAGTTVTCTFTNPAGVQPNLQYWIGIMCDSIVQIQVADTNNPTAGFWDMSFGNGPPETLGRTADSPSQPVPQMWGDFSGSSVFEARAYVYTWMSAYGEEGPPSAATIVNGWSNGTWTISLFTPVATDMGVNRNLTQLNIYRTVSAVSGATDYYLVATLPIGTTTYVDTSDDSDIALANNLLSYTWSAPPTDLQGIVAVPNGMTVGWRANELWFSEVYRPHAWPPNYVLTTEFPIVGLGVCGQSIIICTSGPPYIAGGVNPQTMALTKINLPEPCLSKGSIVPTDTTVLYQSQNGLIQVTNGGVGSNITELWISREKWQQLTPQKFTRAIKLASCYFAFGSANGVPPFEDDSVAQQGFTVELSIADQTSFTILPQAGGHRLGFGELSAPNLYNIDNVLVDPWTGTGLLIQNGGVYYYDFTDPSPVIVPYTWRSKIYQQLTRKNFSACRVFFTVPPGTPQQGTRNTSDPQPTLGPTQYGIIRFFADGNLLTTREIWESGELIRIYSSTKVEQWQIEIEGRVDIDNVQVATTVKELGEI